jgi:dolichyl-phosphate beta-glucosyltransferase
MQKLKQKNNYLFSIIIPAFNEEKSIENTIKKIRKGLQNESHEIIVVDDGSTDKTLEILKKNKYIKIIHLDKNKGKGFALKTGFLKAQGDFVVMIDVDLSTPIETLLEIKNDILSNDVVIGSRLLKTNKEIIQGPISRRVIRQLSRILRKILFNIEIQDTQCGFKIFKNEIAKKIANKMTIDRFGADLEKIIIAHKLTNKIKEVPVKWTHDKNSSTVNLISDSFKTFKEWLKIRSNLRKELY